MPQIRIDPLTGERVSDGGSLPQIDPLSGERIQADPLDFGLTPASLRNSGQGPTVEAAKALNLQKAKQAPVVGPAEVAPQGGSLGGAIFDRLKAAVPDPIGLVQKAVGGLDTILGSRQPAGEQDPLQVNLPDLIRQGADVKGRAYRTYAEDLGHFASAPPTTQQMFADPATLVTQGLMAGKPGQAGLAAIEGATGLPVTAVPDMVEQGQIPELIGHGASALTLLGTLGKLTHNASQPLDAAKPSLAEKGKGWVERELSKQAELAKVNPPHPGAGNLEIFSKLDALAQDLARERQGTVAPSPEFVPVGEEPSYQAPTFPNAAEVVSQRVRENRGRSPERGQTAAQAALGVEATHLPQPPQIDPMTGERLGSDRPSLLNDETGAVGEATGSGPIWYSRLERGVDRLGPAQAHPSKWLSIAKSVTSRDEVKWTGLENWLKEQGDRKVGKAEVADYLKRNKLEVEEVELTDPADIVHKSDDTINADAHGDHVDLLAAQIGDLERKLDQEAIPENRRALLDERDQLLRQMGDAQEAAQYSEANLGEGSALPTRYHPDNGHGAELSLPGGKRYRELLIKFPIQEDQRWVGERPAGGQDIYNSGHWPGQPNVLAHVRFNDRTGPNGERILHIEEVQSDWGQEARTKGIETPEKAAGREQAQATLEEFRKKMDDANEAYYAALDKAANNFRAIRPIPEEGYAEWQRGYAEAMRRAETSPELRALKAARDKTRQEFEALRRSWSDQLRPGVPDAPFISDHSWQQLAMKRMLRYAAENGYDQLSWTTGLQQTRRYNEALGKALGEKKIRWEYEPVVDPESRIETQRSDNISLVDKDGATLWTGPPSDLPGVVGRELSAKIMADVEAGRKNLIPRPEGDTTTSGETEFGDLEGVGSGGMIQEYDKNLPNFLNKYAKGWGASVGKGKINLDRRGTQRPESIPAATWDRFIRHGEEATRAYLKSRHASDIDTQIKEMQNALDIRNQERQAEVWTLPITQAMKQSVLTEGQPLGQTRPNLLLHMGGAALGGVIGGTQGDDPKERIRNAFLGAALGGALPAARMLLPNGERRRAVTMDLPIEVRRRLTQRTALPASDALFNAANTLRHDILGDTFQSEYALKRAGFADVANEFTKYKSARLDILTNQVERLKKVLLPLISPEDYRDFWSVVRLRRDANTAAQGLPLEDGLERGAVVASLRTLTSRLEREAPQVLQAAELHRQLMAEIGAQLVADGQLHASTVARNGEYFPEYVMEYLSKTYKPTELRLQRTAPLTAGKRGFLKEREGGERETLRDYGAAMLRYMKEVEEAHLKDGLIDYVKRNHDASDQMVPTDENPRPGLPADHTFWLYKGSKDGEAMVLPKALASRLDKWQETPSPVVKAFQRANNAWKTLTLRAIWAGFTLQNFLGDVSAHFLFSPLTSWPDAAKNLALSFNAVNHQMKGTLPDSPRLREALRLAEEGKVEGLGSGAATAESNPERYDPQLRQLRAKKEGAARVLQKAGDILSWTVHKSNLMREYMENVPRTAQYMTQLEQGHAPAAAARLTRKIMIDYADLSQAETSFLKGVLFPFYTFYKKNFTRFTPGLDAEIGAGKQFAAIGKGMGLLTAATAYNQWVAPDIEDNLPDWQRNQFHFVVPVGNQGDYWLLSIADPLTLAMSQVGMGGAPQRIAGLIRGRKDFADEFRETTSQFRNSLVSPLTPFLSEPLAQLTGQDLRTGQNITDPKATASENATARVKHAASTLLAPAQQALRAKRETGDDGVLPSGETMGQLIWQHALGRTATRGNVNDDFRDRAYQAVGQASAKQQADTYQAKVAAATAFEESFSGKKPKEVAEEFGRQWELATATLKSVEEQKWQAIAIETLKRMAAKDKRLQPLLRDYQLKMVKAGAKTTPYLQDAFKKLTPPAKR